MGHRLATIALGPILLAQGRWARARTPRLPEPPGARRGVTDATVAKPLRLLVVGDSSGAGVGAEHQEEALLGRVVESLSDAHAVAWRLEARTGATTAGTLRHLERLERETFDVAVTALGVNDVVSGVGMDGWLEDQARLRTLLGRRFGVRTIVVSGLPPVHGFPALPQPLRWYMGRRAKEFDAALREVVSGERGCVFLPLDFTEDVALMADDGFHPGPADSREWGARAATLVERAH